MSFPANPKVYLHCTCAASAAASHALRVVTYNIHGWRDAEHADNLPRLIELLQSLRPDVLCLNEVLHPFVAPAPDDEYWQTVRERRGHGYPPPAGTKPDGDADPSNYLCRLASALDMPHVAFGAAAGADETPLDYRRSFFGQYPFGNAVLSRHALHDVRHHELAVGPDDLDLGGQARTPDDLEVRAATTAQVALPGGGRFGVCVTHLDHKAELLRERQMSEVLAACRDAFGGGGDGSGGGGIEATGAASEMEGVEQSKELEGEVLREVPHIICGDLNSFDKRDMDDKMWLGITSLYAERGWPPPAPDSLVQGVLHRAGYADAFAAAQAEGTGTLAIPPRTCWTMTRLDYMMLSPRAQQALRVAAHETVESDASDHMPVVCTVDERVQ